MLFRLYSQGGVHALKKSITMTNCEMTRHELRTTFRQNYGAAAKLARDLNVSRTTISKWFQGHVTSLRIERAVRTRAAELGCSEQIPATQRRPLDFRLDY
jgi:transcriptional regulator with XRE-family HTH domain